MKPELENQLYSIDPIFFEEAIACQNGEMNERQTCMYFGCECGDGWFEPIKELAKKTALLNELAKEYNAKIVCEQLKEKYGKFTCYTTIKFINEEKSNNEININKINILSKILDNIIDDCEKQCWHVCERCGEKGDYKDSNLITTLGWISRICKKCANSK